MTAADLGLTTCRVETEPQPAINGMIQSQALAGTQHAVCKKGQPLSKLHGSVLSAKRAGRRPRDEVANNNYLKRRSTFPLILSSRKNRRKSATAPLV